MLFSCLSVSSNEETSFLDGRLSVLPMKKPLQFDDFRQSRVVRNGQQVHIVHRGLSSARESLDCSLAKTVEVLGEPDMRDDLQLCSWRKMRCRMIPRGTCGKLEHV